MRFNLPYESPNGHDYNQLEIIYGHLDLYDSYSSGSDDDDGDGGTKPCNAPPGKGCNKSRVVDDGWGMSLDRSGQLETFIRIDADGTRHITHVIWAIRTNI